MSFGAYVKIKFTNAQKAAYLYKGLVYANKKYYRLQNCKPRIAVLLFAPALLFKIFFRRAYTYQLFFFHNLLLNSACQEILRDWKLILKNNINKIKTLNCKFVDASSCLEKMSILRSLGSDFFKTDIATHFLREIYNNFITEILVSQNISKQEALKACAQFSNNITLNMNSDLEIIKRSSNKSPLLEKFLEKHGHLTTSWDVAHLTLGENKKALEELIRKPTSKTTLSQSGDNFVYNNSKNNKIFMKALENTQNLARADEEQHFFAGLHVSKARELLLSLARNWQANNILFEVDDIFYLTIEETEQFLLKPEYALKYVARRRKKIWQRYAEIEQNKITPQESYNNTVQGLAASPGRATGALFVAQSFSDLSSMPEDAILYVRTPNPSYVPWFDRCKALLTETGGILSHGFIAARELHLPAVSGISIDKLKTNNLVTVDGDSGEVFFH